MRRTLTTALLISAVVLVSPAPASSATQASGIELSIQTVPALEGITFRVFLPCSLYVPRSEVSPEFCHSEPVPNLQSWVLVTGQDGSGSVSLPGPGLYRVYAEESNPADPAVRATFSRWQDDVFTNTRELRVSAPRQLTAGFDISRPVNLEFGGAGSELPSGRVSVAEFRSSLGAVVHLEGAGPHWVPAEHILNRDVGLESVPIVYALQRVEVDGSNVVNRGQQRFVAGPEGSSWRIEPLLFSARFVARDAFFGHPVGDGIILEYPDGSTREFDYSGGDAVNLEDLARGTYRVSASGAAGIAPPTIMVLSRNQTVSPVVITWLDIGVVVAGSLILAVSLLLIGRPHLLPTVSRGSRGPGSGAGEST